MSERPLRIGISCFSTFGGSGVIAAEIGMSLAERGHQIHFISDDVPSRLETSRPNVFFHAVPERHYVALKHSPYALALTAKMIDVARAQRLDVLHAHYAVPHAVSAYLAAQVLGAAAPRIVTTLHGTDITLVGSDPMFLPLVRFAITASDALTVPSVWLADATHQLLDVPRDIPIEVIPNFVDTERFHPADPGARPPASPRVLIHVSNFRPLKRVDDVVQIFARARVALAPVSPLVLLLVGDGPERPRIEELVRALGLGDAVSFLGEQIELPEVLRGAELFLLPSQTESFGLAALEAMACGVPVIASDVGGLPEVVTPDAGVLAPVGDVAAMAATVVDLLSDPARHARLAAGARRRAELQFSRAVMVDRYEAAYRRVLSSSSSSRRAPS